MMGIIALSFFTVLGILASEYYTTIVAMNNGLQQCQIWDTTHTTYSIVWQEKCQ